MKFRQSRNINKISTEAKEFINFVNNSPSPFHAVEEARTRLVGAGFEEIKEYDSWEEKLKPNGKYYFTRNRSTIVAFAIGGLYKVGNGISMVGAHTDSPCLKEKAGYLQIGVETYGGGIWHTWFDRDLSVAGRVMLENPNGKFEHRLVKINSLENQTVEEANKNSSNKPKHHPGLLSALAEEIGIQDPSKIHDFELCLYDTQPSTFGGLYQEFIFSPRLDNLMMSFTALKALINSSKNPEESLSTDNNIRLISLFDNEEIGSTSAHGANSSLLENTLRRLSSANIDSSASPSRTIFEESMHKSFMISADMSHAIHPNYSEKHEENHRPEMNNGRYATTAVTTLVLREAAKKYKVPLQEFVVRADSRCGSTIGPMISANCGLRTIDVGNPQLSMHSIRETAGTDDVDHAINLFQGFFEEFSRIDKSIVVD
ncbi:9404_t:CDS:10 [Entrophospora sp. SA101]|nr:9032_t:CDS:10 [Entrophospora sp. SA101]CAJ0766146.1 9404_t:CDS:10 [Entrophospora sp. SA101]